MGPVVIRADLVVPPVSAEGAAVCVYRCVFFHFIDEYGAMILALLLVRKRTSCVPFAG